MSCGFRQYRWRRRIGRPPRRWEAPMVAAWGFGCGCAGYKGRTRPFDATCPPSPRPLCFCSPSPPMSPLVLPFFPAPPLRGEANTCTLSARSMRRSPPDPPLTLWACCAANCNIVLFAGLDQIAMRRQALIVRLCGSVSSLSTCVHEWRYACEAGAVAEGRTRGAPLHGGGAHLQRLQA